MAVTQEDDEEEEVVDAGAGVEEEVRRLMRLHNFQAARALLHTRLAADPSDYPLWAQVSLP